MFLHHISSPISKYYLIEIIHIYTSGLKCILGQYAFKPSVNICDCEIVFHDSQQKYLKWE